MAADGSIVIQTELNDKKAQAELNRLAKKIEQLNEQLSEKKGQQSAVEVELKAASEEALKTTDRISELKAELESVKQITDIANTEAAGDPLRVLEALERQKEITSELAEQEKLLKQQDKDAERLASQYAKSTDAVNKAEAELEKAEIRAGELAEQLSGAGDAGNRAGNQISVAMEQAQKRMEKFEKRIIGLAKRVFVFTLITKALRSVRDYVWQAIKTNQKATEAVSQLRGALLTLVQPLIQLIIPAFTRFVEILTKVVSVTAAFVSKIFGTTAEQSADAAKKMNDEAKAINKVGKEAKKATKALAAFDEINKLTEDTETISSDTDTDEILAKFDVVKQMGDWLNNALSGIEAKVTAALLLGGIALVAIGAATGNLGLVIAGLLLLGAGIAYGKESGVLEDWAKKLGLDKAQSLIATALILGGIALVAIGAALGNILLVIAGLALLGAGIYYINRESEKGNWTGDSLSKVTGYLSAALYLGGIALVAIGAALGNILMVLAGLALLAAGVAVEKAGDGELKSWWEALKLTTVEQWVSVALLLGGIVLIAAGAAKANILMVLGGLLMIGFGTELADKDGNLEDWVKVLGLEKVTGWVTVASLLAGIALLVFGIVTANIPMAVAGIGLFIAGLSIEMTTSSLEKWWDSLNLTKVTQYVSVALKLGGIALAAIGAATANLLMILAGLGLLGAGIALSDKNGNKLNDWVTALGIDKVLAQVATGIKMAGVAIIAIGAATANLALIVAGLGLLGVGIGISSSISKSSYSLPSTSSIYTQRSSLRNAPAIPAQSIPALARGAVIPPNREFLAVLGDQSSGNNIEAPEALLRQMAQEAASANTELLREILQAIRAGQTIEVDRQPFGRVVRDAYDRESARAGASFVQVT